MDLTATLDGRDAYGDADFVVIAAPTNYDPVKDYFDTSCIEAVIDLVQLSWWKIDKMLKDGDIKEIALNWIEQISETVSGNPRKYIDNTIAVIEDVEKQ